MAHEWRMIRSVYDRALRCAEFQPKVMAYYFKRWRDYRMPIHTHNAAEIMYVLTGTCAVETTDTTYTLTKHDVIFLDANVPHRLLVGDQPARILNVEFSFAPKSGSFPSIADFVQESRAFAQFLEAAQSVIVLRDPQEMVPILKNVVRELDECGGEMGMMVHLLLGQLFIRLARLYMERENSPADSGEKYVRLALDFMHHHYDCDVKVADVAADVHVHPGYLQRIFKANTGKTVLEYLQFLRMEKAKMLLVKSEIPVTHIAEYIGMNSSQYFSTLFKKYTGQTPRQYRQERQNHERVSLYEV